MPAFFTGDVAPVDTGKHCHDAETAAAGCHYVLVVFGIYAVHVDAFACQSAVGFGSVPEVIEGPVLYGVQQASSLNAPDAPSDFFVPQAPARNNSRRSGIYRFTDFILFYVQ